MAHRGKTLSCLLTHTMGSVCVLGNFPLSVMKPFLSDTLHPSAVTTSHGFPLAYCTVPTPRWLNMASIYCACMQRERSDASKHACSHGSPALKPCRP